MLRRRMLLKGGLPNGYKKLEFIRNTSTAYIDTGLKPNYTFEYELKAEAHTGNLVMGMLYKDDNADYRFFCPPSPFYFDVGSKRIVLTNSHSWGVYHVKLGNYYIKDLDNNTEVKGSTQSKEVIEQIITSNIYLLYGYGNITGYIYLFKMWDNGKLVRDFVPCRHLSDNKVGMYDLVEKKFYTSPNGTAFIGSDEPQTTNELLEGEIISDDEETSTDFVPEYSGQAETNNNV